MIIVMTEYTTIVAWVQDAPAWERACNVLPVEFGPDISVIKAPADDWIQCTVDGPIEVGKTQFTECAEQIGMPYRIDEVNYTYV